MLLQSLNNLFPIATTILGDIKLSLYLGRDEVDYWGVPITFEKKEMYWKTNGVLFSHNISQYGSWVGERRTPRDSQIASNGPKAQKR